MKTILIMAGGTGGHVYPALSVAKSLMNHRDWSCVAGHPLGTGVFSGTG